jgi:hypothetical protein
MSVQTDVPAECASAALLPLQELEHRDDAMSQPGVCVCAYVRACTFVLHCLVCVCV